MNKSGMLTGIAATGVLGYAIAVWLARATEFAEKVEEDEYCQDPPATPPAATDALPTRPLSTAG